MNNRLPRHGFTMVEVVMALAIIAVVAGMAVPALRGWNELARLREPADGLSRVVHQARARAFMENKKFLVVLNEKSFSLRAAEVVKDAPPDIETFTLPEGMDWEVQGWAQREWLRPNGRIWVFAPGDLAEPLSVRFHRGEQVITQRYEPLSASVAGEELIVP